MNSVGQWADTYLKTNYFRQVFGFLIFESPRDWKFVISNPESKHFQILQSRYNRKYKTENF